MNRRELGGAIAGAGAFLVAGACIATPEPLDAPSARRAGGGDADARLVAYGREVPGLLAEYKRLSVLFYSKPLGGHAALDAIASQMDPIGRRLEHIMEDAAGSPVASQPARAAKALVLMAMLDLQFGDHVPEIWKSDEPYTALAWSLAGDVMLERGAV